MRKFFKNDDGLVTIEWVGVAAVMLVAAIAIAALVSQGTTNAAGTLGDNVETMTDGAVAPAIGPFVPAS